MTYQLSHRKAAISFIKNGGSKVEASRIFSVSRNTLYSWLKLDDLTPKPPLKMRHRKIDKEELKAHAEEYPDMFLHERAVIFKVHPSAISYALKSLNIVKKKNVDI